MIKRKEKKFEINITPFLVEMKDEIENEGKLE